MSREIKFRAWSGKRMLCEDSFFIRYGKAYEFMMFDEPRKTDYPIMQYTGLKDVNGAEIYEGDVVVAMDYPFYGDDDAKELNYVGEVYYWIEESAFYVDIHRVSDRVAGRAAGGSMSEYFEKLKVIGNIYENPELLDN